jgi:fructose-1,6-bisphosphatase I
MPSSLFTLPKIEVNKAGLVDILGDHGSTNVQGETVKKLDVFANEQFIAALGAGGECCAIASEENEDIIHIDNVANAVKNSKGVPLPSKKSVGT